MLLRVCLHNICLLIVTLIHVQYNFACLIAFHCIGDQRTSSSLSKTRNLCWVCYLQMRLDNAPMGIRRGGKLPLKDLVKAADGNIEGLKQLLKSEWELPEDVRVAVFGIDCDGVEFEFTPTVAHDLTGTLAGAQAVLLRVLTPQHLQSTHGIHAPGHGHPVPVSSTH